MDVWVVAEWFVRIEHPAARLLFAFNAVHDELVQWDYLREKEEETMKSFIKGRCA